MPLGKFGQTGFFCALVRQASSLHAHLADVVVFPSPSWEDTLRSLGDRMSRDRGSIVAWPGRSMSRGRRVRSLAGSIRGVDAMSQHSRAWWIGFARLLVIFCLLAIAPSRVVSAQESAVGPATSSAITPSHGLKTSTGRHRASRGRGGGRQAPGRDQRDLDHRRRGPGHVAQGRVLARGDRPDPGQERRPHDVDELRDLRGRR